MCVRLRLSCLHVRQARSTAVFGCKPTANIIATNMSMKTRFLPSEIKNSSSDLRNPYMLKCASGSSVGIATDYGLDGPGSNPGGDEIFRLSRQALRPTQPPVKWVTGLSRW